MATAPKSLPGFVEKTIVVPQRLWNRVEELADDTARDPSEVVAEALRLLVAGGGAPAAAPGGVSIAAVAEASSGAEAAQVLSVPSGNLETQLADVRDAEVDSDRLLERIEKVAQIVDHRDGFLGGHSRSVADVALRLGDLCGVEGDARRELELAALAHDLGKSRIPETILCKQGRLTPEEWALVKQYPEMGAEILRPFDHLENVRNTVMAHQERWDGSGYPHGTKGDDIPLAAQIVGLCDVYMVLTSERSYRPALADDTARRTIESGADRLWNPDLVTKLLRRVVDR